MCYLTAMFEEKIKELRAQIAKLQETLNAMSGEKIPGGADIKKQILAKIAQYDAEIKKITDVGNGDGTGRKPISARGEQRTAISKPV